MSELDTDVAPVANTEVVPVPNTEVVTTSNMEAVPVPNTEAVPVPNTEVMLDPVITPQPNDQSVNNSEDRQASLEAGEQETKTEDEKANGSKPGDSKKTDLENVEKDGEVKSSQPLPSNNECNHKEVPSKFNRNKERGSKFDPRALPISDDSTSIRTQVEFYFSDSNLPTDKYMTTLAGVSGTNPVKITEIHRFGRMQRFQPYSAVVGALRDSHFLEVSGSEGLETVRRKFPFDPSQKDEAREARTIYAKGFGAELPTTQFDIEAFFAPYGPTNAVRLRRTEDKVFKSSCFIEFQDEQIAEKFLNLDPKPLWQGRVALEIMSKREYVSKKNEQLRSGEISPKKTRVSNRGRGRGSFRGEYRGGRERQDRGYRDPDDWKKRREDDQKSGFQDYNRERNYRGRGGRGRGRGDKNRLYNDRGYRQDSNGDRNPQDGNGEHRQNGTGDKDPQKDNGERRQNGNENKGSQDDEGKHQGQNENSMKEDMKSFDDTTKMAEQDPSKKRAREDDTGEEEVPTKKVDTKETGTSVSS